MPAETWFIIHYPLCGNYDWWSVQSTENLSGNGVILTIFLSSSFLDSGIFTHFLEKKMRITLFISNHRYAPFQIHHLSIMASHHFPGYPISSLYASYQLKGLRKYVLFQLRNAPVYGKQVLVLFHLDTDWLPWSCGTYGDSIVLGDSDTLSGSELYIFWWYAQHFQLTSYLCDPWLLHRSTVQQDLALYGKFLNSSSDDQRSYL